MASSIRRSGRLQQKTKSVVKDSLEDESSDNGNFYFEDESEDSNYDESKHVASKLTKQKRKKRANWIVAEETIIDEPVAKKKRGKPQKDNYLVKKKQEKQLSIKKPLTDERNISGIKSGFTKSDKKLVKQRVGRKRQISISSSSSSFSEDEWEEMEEIGFVDEEVNCDTGQDGTLEVTIKAAKPVETEESKWAKFIRQQVNRKIRERQINCHKMHLLCYIAHLRFWTRALLQDEALTPLCLSLIPEGYIIAAKHGFDVATIERFLHWFRSAFQRAQKDYSAKNGFCCSQIERMEELIGDRAYEDDKDLASLLFLFIVALKHPARLCLSCQPVGQKLTASMLRSEHTDAFVKENINNTDNLAVWERKLYDATKKVEFEINDASFSENFAEESSIKNSRKTKIETVKSKKKSANSTDEDASTSKVQPQKIRLERNYWVEYWDDSSSLWICLDPWSGSVDMPETLEADATSPMHYVVCIDDELSVRDVTARYASKFLSPELRRLRVDPEWWNQTLKIYRSKNRKRERLEDVALHDYLLSKPKPLTVAEYKNHPLYVLKKDILKYEAIYPESQLPIGQIRGNDIYPRSSVFHLDGSLNWMKQARMVKAGEKPYKIVKGRVNHRIPPEMREPRSLELYGYWQTEPYIPPKVIDGRIPRNEFGNLYVYKSSMVPEGCVHLRLDGLIAVARRLDIDCVPAVVGWEFHKGGNHPIIEGCVVLKEHEKALRQAWREFYERKQVAAEKRRKERAVKNWRRLVKGLLTLVKVRAKFLVADGRDVQVDEKLENEEAVEVLKTETPATDDMALAWPKTAFPLPGNNAGKC